VTWRYFDVATQYFKEILLDLKKKQQKKRKELIKPIECSDVRVECE